MDYFKDINERLKASEERWKQINHISEELRLLEKHDEGCGNNCDIRRIYDIEALVLLLIEELRPMCNAGEQIKELESEITDMLKNFEVKK